jgi:hypothetical protein
MMITWITLDMINDSVVEYGLKGLNMRENGTYESIILLRRFK